MKTFKDLQKGDKIYYWDKGKLHAQDVHEVKCEEQVETYTDWFGHKKENKRTVLKLVAGKNGRTKVTLHWDADRSYAKFGRMPRFACIEAANNWLDERKYICERKVNKLERQLAKYKLILARYTDSEG